MTVKSYPHEIRVSARDDLDRFDSEWKRHSTWRIGANYVVTTGIEVVSIVLKELPSALRSAVIADLEASVGALIDSKKAAIRAGLVAAAKREAQRTLEELE